MLRSNVRAGCGLLRRSQRRPAVSLHTLRSPAARGDRPPLVSGLARSRALHAGVVPSVHRSQHRRRSCRLLRRSQRRPAVYTPENASYAAAAVLPLRVLLQHRPPTHLAPQRPSSSQGLFGALLFLAVAHFAALQRRLVVPAFALGNLPYIFLL